jgi:DNA-binding ferritin-like protein
MPLNSQDKQEIERIAKKEIRDFMNSTQAHKIVVQTIKDELGLGSKKVDDKIVDLSTKVVVELFKTLWQRKSFWESSLKNVK